MKNWTSGPTVIGLTGKKQAGKDTAAQVIQEIDPEFKRIAFADKIKEATAAILGISLEEVEKYKSQEDKYLYLWDIVHHEDNTASLISKQFCNMREFLQRFGTEFGRNMVDKDFWVNLALKDLDPNGKYVITDCRFINEAHRIRALGGRIFLIERPSLNYDADFHISESGIPEWMVTDKIVNDGNKDDLKVKIEKCLFK